MESGPLLAMIGGVAVGTAALTAFIWNRFSGVYRAVDASKREITEHINHNRRNNDHKFNLINDKLTEMDKDMSLRLQRLENGTADKHG